MGHSYDKIQDESANIYLDCDDYIIYNNNDDYDRNNTIITPIYFI